MEVTPHLRETLEGISGILVTPYDRDGELRPGSLDPVIDRAVEAGVHSLVVNGNTSEFFALTVEEAGRMAREVAARVGSRAPVIAGVGRGVRDAMCLARISANAGVAALMVHQPADAFVSGRGLLDYVKAVSDAADGLPIMLYLRNDMIGTKSIVELCSLPAVAGVKWASTNPMKLAEARSACPAHLIWVAGLAEAWAPVLYAVGARGFTSGLINVWPERSVAIHAALAAGDFTKADALIDGMRVFEHIRAEEMGGTNVTAVKAALQAQGLDCGSTRPPSSWPLDQIQAEKLRRFLIGNGLVQGRGNSSD